MDNEFDIKNTIVQKSGQILLVSKCHSVHAALFSHH